MFFKLKENKKENNKNCVIGIRDSFMYTLQLIISIVTHHWFAFAWFVRLRASFALITYGIHALSYDNTLLQASK